MANPCPSRGTVAHARGPVSVPSSATNRQDAMANCTRRRGWRLVQATARSSLAGSFAILRPLVDPMDQSRIATRHERAGVDRPLSRACSIRDFDDEGFRALMTDVIPSESGLP